MKFIILLVSIFYLAHGVDESKQVQTNHPMQDTHDTHKLLQQMQANIKTYLYQTPLSSYEYFDKKSAKLQSQSLITWIHGDIYLKTLAVGEEPYIRATLNDGQSTHLGDYRYDMFTLLSDLLLKMQEDSDFSGSKEKAILNTLVDGYFDKLKNSKQECPCIDDALVETKKSELLFQYTKIRDKNRYFKMGFEGLSKVDKKNTNSIKKEMNRYFSKFKLLPLKDIAIDRYGNYMLLCEGKSKSAHDDMIFTLSASTLPISYYINSKMKKKYLNKSRLQKKKAVSSFNQTQYAGSVKINNQDFFVDKLNPTLQLNPNSEDTSAYKKYASALGYMLASFHSNPSLKSCKSFSEKVNTQVKPRVVKTEIISMVYAYNETLESKWESFTDKELLSLK